MLDSRKYGNKFDKLIESELIDFQSEIKSLAKEINKQGENAGVFAVNQKVVIKNDLSERLQRAFDEAVKGGYQEAFQESLELFEKSGVPIVELPQASLGILKAVKESAFTKLSAYSQIDATDVWRSLVGYSITGNQEYLENVLLENLTKAQIKQYGLTTINTNIDTFYRTTNAIRGKEAGVEKWRYAGPPPDRIFCNLHIGKTYTLEEIDMLDNNQGLDVFYSGGGYNCRHYWIPVL